MILVIVAYAMYTGGIGTWQYFMLTNIVEDALNRELPTLTERSLPGVARVDPGERVARIHEGVLKAASLADVPLSAEEVAVAAAGNVLTVRVRHAYPLMPARAPKFDLHLVVERSLTLP